MFTIINYSSLFSFSRFVCRRTTQVLKFLQLRLNMNGQQIATRQIQQQSVPQRKNTAHTMTIIFSFFNNKNTSKLTLKTKYNYHSNRKLVDAKLRAPKKRIAVL